MSNPTNGRKWAGRAAAVLAGLVVVVAIIFLAFNVAREMRLLGSARSDNVQWNLSQTEVEFLVFAALVDAAVADPAAELRDLRRKFDVFFSRMQTLSEASMYAELQTNQDFFTAFSEVRAFLDHSSIAIDSDDKSLRAALPKIQSEITMVRTNVRRLSVSGINHFATASDMRRKTVAVTLMELAFVVIGLIVALGYSILYLNRLNSQNRQKQREISLAATRMKTVISTSLDGVIVADSSGSILEFNGAAEVMFGYKEKDVIGRDLGEIFIPDHLRGAYAAELENMRKTGKHRLVGRGRVKMDAMRSTGEVFPVELAIQTAQTDSGEIFTAFMRDISKRMKAEKELVMARDRALAGERIKTDFLVTMSHEIRTPLNGLLGNLSLIQDTKLTAKQGRYIRDMEKSGRLLYGHVSDVLDITRYDAGKLKIRKVPMNLGLLIQDIIDSLSGTAGANGTSLEWGWIGPAMNWISSDPVNLQHILINLVGNAVKFTRNGKVTVSAETISKPGGVTELNFIVADTGVGIEPDLQTSIFDDFVTGNTAYDREVGGTGLGLSIAQRFAAAMGGDITLKESSRNGTKFLVRIPVTISKPMPPILNRPAQRPLQKPLNVLIVEDNEINRVVLREMLHAEGHTTTEARDGQEGVLAAAQTCFDLIFMDISMPVMDGCVATQAIRSGNGASARTQIVALTANAMAAEQASFLASGMNSVLTKPLSREALLKLTGQFSKTSLEPTPVTAVKNLLEMRETVGETAFLSLRDRFIDQAEALLTQIKSPSSIAPKDLQAHCHKIAGSAAAFGATSFCDNLKALEAASKAGDPVIVKSHAAATGPIWTATKAVLEA